VDSAAPELLPQLLGEHRDSAALVLSDIALNFGGVRAIDGLSLAIRSGEIHGLIAQWQRKTTALNVISATTRRRPARQH